MNSVDNLYGGFVFAIARELLRSQPRLYASQYVVRDLSMPDPAVPFGVREPQGRGKEGQGHWVPFCRATREFAINVNSVYKKADSISKEVDIPLPLCRATRDPTPSCGSLYAVRGRVPSAKKLTFPYCANP